MRSLVTLLSSLLHASFSSLFVFFSRVSYVLLVSVQSFFGCLSMVTITKYVKIVDGKITHHTFAFKTKALNFSCLCWKTTDVIAHHLTPHNALNGIEKNRKKKSVTKKKTIETRKKQQKLIYMIYPRYGSQPRNTRALNDEFLYFFFSSKRRQRDDSNDIPRSSEESSSGG